MKKIAIFSLLFVLLFAVDCSLFKRDLSLEPEVNALRERIEKLEEESKRLQEDYSFQKIDQAQELESIKEFIRLLEIQQNKLSKKVIRPYIPDSITFCGEQVPLDRLEVREKLEWALLYETNRWAMALIFLRSGRWFPMIEEKIKELELPEDLKYVAAVESALNPIAGSDAKAVGLWQFIKNTAVNIMKMTVSSYIDERYDPEKSTEAGLKHLKELYEDPKLDGWIDALAGYNMHKDRYAKEKAKERAQDSYDVKDTPLENQRYPFRVIAVKLIMENPEKYGFPSLEEIEKIKYNPYPLKAETITVNQRRERIVDIAQRLDMTYYEFRTFNPHILIKKSTTRSSYGEVIRDWLPRGQYKVYVKTKKTQ